MEFRRNELINDTLDKHFETWSHTLDTADFVPAKYLGKIDKYIFKLLKRKLKETEIFYLLYLKEKGYKLGLFEKLRIAFSGLRPLYENEELVENLQVEVSYLREELEKLKNKKCKKRSEDVKTKE